jgi:hypothetical protein
MKYVKSENLNGNLISVSNYQKLQLVNFEGKDYYYLPASFQKNTFSNEKLKTLEEMIKADKSKTEISEMFNYGGKKLDSFLTRKYKTCKLNKIKEILLNEK